MKWSNKYMGIKINLKIILYILSKKKKKYSNKICIVIFKILI